MRAGYRPWRTLRRGFLRRPARGLHFSGEMEERAPGAAAPGPRGFLLAAGCRSLIFSIVEVCSPCGTIVLLKNRMGGVQRKGQVIWKTATVKAEKIILYPPIPCIERKQPP